MEPALIVPVVAVQATAMVQEMAVWSPVPVAPVLVPRQPVAVPETQTPILLLSVVRPVQLVATEAIKPWPVALLPEQPVAVPV